MLTTTDRVRLIEIAIEELRALGPGADNVLDWFGERDAEREAAWHDGAGQVLSALVDSSEQGADLDVELHGDWVKAIPAAWAFARMGRAHQTPVTDNGETTLGGPDLTVLKGPLRFEGRVSIRGLVVVIGDLTIDGFLDHATDPGWGLIVIGNERVRVMHVGWTHFVIGTFDAEVEHWSYNSINEGLFFVGGPAHAQLVIQEPYSEDRLNFEFHGKKHENGPAERLREFVSPLPEGVELTGELVCELVVANKAKVKAP